MLVQLRYSRRLPIKENNPKQIPADEIRLQQLEEHVAVSLMNVEGRRIPSGMQEISVCAHGFAWPLHQDDTAQIEKSWRTIFSGLSLHMKTMWIRVRPCGSRKVRVAPADSSHGSGAAVRSPRA